MEYVCRHCVYFKPHIYFPYIGYCAITREGVYEKVEVCEKFRKTSLEELREILRREGWVYCVSCRKTIVDEKELVEHMEKHVVAVDVVIDEAVAEEAPLAD